MSLAVLKSFLGVLLLLVVFVILYISYEEISPAYDRNRPHGLNRIRHSPLLGPAVNYYQTIPNILPMLYVVTPTYTKPTQVPELLALANSLRNVQQVTWIIVEDRNETSLVVAQLLQRSQLPFVHLLAPMDEKDKKLYYWRRPRGATNRNKALQWIRDNVKDGVVYFADDDNTYDPLLFDQIRFTKTISFFPVGLVTGFKLTSPVVRNGVITGFYDGWVGGRKYPTDMAEFAVNIQFLLSRPKAKFVVKSGQQETKFLVSLEPFNLSDMEPMARNCTQLLAFHTKSGKT